MNEVLVNSPSGLYCPAGDFYIDPWTPVNRAVVTHAHSDHARWGHRSYLAADVGVGLLRMRLGSVNLHGIAYGETIRHGAAAISLHPAGHMLGSAQVRVEVGGRIAVVTGDYKLGSDPTCMAWEPVPCHLLVTESTFGLPIYRWPDQQIVFSDMNGWWRENANDGICSILYGYAVGKSQRLLAGLDSSIGPIFTHGAVEKGNQAYRAAGVALPETRLVSEQDKKGSFVGAMVVAVPSAHGTPWMRKFGRSSTAMASGWMMVRGTRRRRAMDRGFILSDHVDWPSLQQAIELCGPEEVWVTHGSTHAVARYLGEKGILATALQTRFGEDEDEEVASKNSGAEV